LPQFERTEARKIREEILRHKQYVDLDSLLDFSWKQGIPVVFLAHLPKAGKGFDGLASYIGNQPVIVLATKRDGPPWLAFHLAHELGHIMLGHVGSNESLLDQSLSTGTATDEHEREADAFAFEILTGYSRPKIDDLRLDASRLAAVVATTAPRQGVDPGVWALIYAKCNDRWALAQQALKYLSLDSGGRERVASALATRMSDLELLDLSEADERFLEVLTPE
jgi:hypothetical protein